MSVLRLGCALLGSGAIAIAIACTGGVFACEQDGDCLASGDSGTCQAEGVCSFPDPDCASGQRFGEHSGSLSGTCVPESEGTSGGGMDDGDPTTASLTGTLDDDGGTTGPATTTIGTTVDPTLDATGDPTTDPTTPTTDDGMADSSGEPPIDPDLLLWFRFEDGLADGLANDGALGGIASCVGEQGCPVANTGAIGGGGQFDGVDDCASFPWTPELDTADGFTVALWHLYDPTATGFASMFAKPVATANYNSWEVYFIVDSDEVRRQRFTVGASTGGVATIPAPEHEPAWTHLAMTFDGELLRAWVDGVLLDEVAPSAPIEFTGDAVFIGCDDNHDATLDGYVRGGLDELRLYARVLSEREIEALAAR